MTIISRWTRTRMRSTSAPCMEAISGRPNQFMRAPASSYEPSRACLREGCVGFGAGRSAGRRRAAGALDRVMVRHTACAAAGEHEERAAAAEQQIGEDQQEDHRPAGAV